MKKILAFIIIIPLSWSCDKDGTNNSDPGSTGQGGSLARFSIVGDYMYAVHGNDIKVFDISNPSSVNLSSNSTVDFNVETIFARDENTLFLGSTNGMYIYDISAPPRIRYLGEYQHVVSCDPVVANEHFAFVTLRSSVNQQSCNRNVNQLDVVDISDLSSPRHIHTRLMHHPIGLGLYGDTLLVCDEGIKVFDVSDINNLKEINHINDIPAVDLIPYGDLIIVRSQVGLSQYRYHNGQLDLLSQL